MPSLFGDDFPCCTSHEHDEPKPPVDPGRLANQVRVAIIVESLRP